MKQLFRLLDMTALLAILSAPVLAAPAGTGDFTLVRDGRPLASIITASNAPKSVLFAAQELQTFVERLSGARLPIVNAESAPAGPKVLVGRSALTDALHADIPSGFSRALKEEGFLIRAEPDTLILAGNDEGPGLKETPANPISFPNTYKGTLFAVYALLEQLGCRWYYPGAFGECLPAARTLAVPAQNRIDRPAFPVRGFWYGLPASQRGDKAAKHDMDLWMLRNRFLPYGAILPSAGDGSVMKPFEKFRTVTTNGVKTKINTLHEEHPEYFALNKDGSRNSHYLCLSNTNVIRIASDYARQWLRDNPDATGFGYAPPDGAPTCECPDCRAANLGFMQKPPADPRIQDISEGFYAFLNQVAAAVASEFPGKWITTTAYSGRIRPPEGVTLHTNISVHIALLGYSAHHRLDFTSWQTREKLKLYERWGQLTPFAVDRPYYPPFQFHAHVPQPLHRTLAFHVRELRRLGLAGSEWEGRCAFMADGLNTYILGRCLWNPDTDIDALLADYYTRFFGAAAAPVRAFYEATEDSLIRAPVDHHEEERIPEIYPYETVRQLTAEAGALESLVKDADPATRQRVRFAKLVMDHFRSYAELRAAESRLEFGQAADHARAMIVQEKEVVSMNPLLIDGYMEDRDSRAAYGELGANAGPRGKLKQDVAKQEMLTGPRGELAVALPTEWEFVTDPRDEGLIAEWFRPGFTNAAWKTISITRPFEPQGFEDDQLHGYDGVAWYRVSFTVPDKFKGRKLTLFVGGLNEQGWFWCNGRLAGAQPFHGYWMRWQYHHEVDLTHFIKFGTENTLAVRIFNEQNFGGLFRRCFIYAPASPPETAKP